MDAIERMNLFTNLIYVSIAIAVVGAGLAVFFFFFFDIRNVYALMTGKAKREVIERMAEQNSRTGRLQATSGNIKPASTSEVRHASVVVENTGEPVKEQPEVSAETTVLGNNEETTILNTAENDAGQTVILRRDPQEAPAAAPASVEPKIRFEITESTLVIHTNEIV